MPEETIELIDQVIEKGDSPEERLRDRTFSNHLMRSLKKFLSFAQAIALFRIISCDAYGGH
ncbi:hypothetical protein [uncultured Nostoc sp.]|uniref:hypothetical protein n=1 Tax=uncultured Nostoc sp. TaxID=340711 RepID=UPI0026080733|nr:hypothetical protein [uncultured Nostoc sp.]